MKIKNALFGALLLATPAVSAFAANPDSGLYDPAPPEGSAFVRFLSIAQDDKSREAKINGKTLEYVRFQQVSPYYVAPGGNADIKFGDASQSATFEAGNFYTVVFENDSRVKVIADAETANQAKSQIIFYNFSQQDGLSLKTSDGKVEVLPSVPPDDTQAREINPVKVSLAVYDGDKVLSDLGAVSLERSHSYNVIAYPNNEVKWAPSVTNTSR